MLFHLFGLSWKSQIVFQSNRLILVRGMYMI